MLGIVTSTSVRNGDTLSVRRDVWQRFTLLLDQKKHNTAFRSKTGATATATATTTTPSAPSGSQGLSRLFEGTTAYRDLHFVVLDSLVSPWREWAALHETLSVRRAGMGCPGVGGLLLTSTLLVGPSACRPTEEQEQEQEQEQALEQEQEQEDGKGWKETSLIARGRCTPPQAAPPSTRALGWLETADLDDACASPSLSPSPTNASFSPCASSSPFGHTAPPKTTERVSDADGNTNDKNQNNKTNHSRPNPPVVPVATEGGPVRPRLLGLPGSYAAILRQRYNASQLRAIEDAIAEDGEGVADSTTTDSSSSSTNRKQSCGFSLVVGPPGTGKTSTVLGILNSLHVRQYNKYYAKVLEVLLGQEGSILQQQRRQREWFNLVIQLSAHKPRILVTAPSNVAVIPTNDSYKSLFLLVSVSSRFPFYPMPVSSSSARPSRLHTPHSTTLFLPSCSLLLVHKLPRALLFFAQVDNILERLMLAGFLDGTGARYNPTLLRLGGGKAARVAAVSLEDSVAAVARLPTSECKDRMESAAAKLNAMLTGVVHLQALCRVLTLAFAPSAEFGLPGGWELRVDPTTACPYWVDHVNQVRSRFPTFL
jgi:hypothetical protein